MSNKTIKKTVRFEEEEFAKVEQKLINHNLTFSEFARSAILEKEIRSKHDITEIHLRKKRVEELSRIGNNLNQIAKSLHTSDIPNSEVIKLLIFIEKKLHDS